MSSIRIATRASSLALWQAKFIQKLLSDKNPARSFELVEITTSGDKNRTQPLAAMGGTGLFTKEVQKAVLDHRADLAVHSLKDLPTATVSNLVLAGVPKRASKYDALVFSPKHRSQFNKTADARDFLKSGLTVGTSSPRRAAQILSLYPQSIVKEIRGNVETRLAKVENEEYDLIVLAVAGLERLGLSAKIDCELRPSDFYPAVAQGALGIECRSDDQNVITMLQELTDPQTLTEVTAERSLLSQLKAGCHAPVGVDAQLVEGTLTLSAVVLSQDGQNRLFSQQSGRSEAPENVATRTTENLLQQGAEELLK